MWYVMLGALRFGDGDGYATFAEARDASVSVLVARRDKIGCGGCQAHRPAAVAACAAYDRLNAAVNAACVMSEPDDGCGYAWRGTYASAYVTITHAATAPGVGLGSKAFERDGGAVTVKLIGDVDAFTNVALQETAQRRGRFGEIRTVLGQHVTPR